MEKDIRKLIRKFLIKEEASLLQENPITERVYDSKTTSDKNADIEPEQKKGPTKLDFVNLPV